MIEARPQAFGDRLASLVEERESQLVLGLDPDPAKLWPVAVEAVDGRRDRPVSAQLGGVRGGSPDATPAKIAAKAVEYHCRYVVEAVGADCVGVKLQLACFERLGAAGWAALGAVVDAAHDHGLIVIADGKRGDVPVTASAYAQAMIGSTPSPWGEIAGLGADAATVNPLMGLDSLEPLVAQAVASHAGVFALVRTSNPGAADIEDLTVFGADDVVASEFERGGAETTRGLSTVSDRIADLVLTLGQSHVGARGLSPVGAVVGATEPGHIERLREAMPHSVFLLPGVGAQGGRVEDLGAAFASGPASALVTVSRALVGDTAAAGGDLGESARAAAADLRERIWSISSQH